MPGVEKIGYARVSPVTRTLTPRSTSVRMAGAWRRASGPMVTPLDEDGRQHTPVGQRAHPLVGAAAAHYRGVSSNLVSQA